MKRMPFWKRLIDVAGATFGLVLLLPLFVVVAVAIKLTSPGPIIFKQRRSGRGGRPFWLYKFRSMVTDAEEKKEELLELNEQDGPAFKMERDPRVTVVGRFLRATTIDELPQLWNVLKGDMSLVGPRPLPCGESDECVGWQRRRLDVTPGLTCFWQVKDQRTKIPFVDWVRMDLKYVKSRSPKVDLSLITETIRYILRRKGC
jgi:lipopolysaccharide/colanic/teichoic acid biosynthesis glycosyltransferase